MTAPKKPGYAICLRCLAYSALQTTTPLPRHQTVSTVAKCRTCNALQSPSRAYVDLVYMERKSRFLCDPREGMYMFMRVFVSVYMCVCVCVLMCMYMRVCVVCVSVYIYIYMYLCMYVCVYVYIYTHARACMYLFACICVCLFIGMYVFVSMCVYLFDYLGLKYAQYD